jgi:hypothetical protein
MADPKIITSVSSVQVPEGGQATFNVRLSSRPRKRSVEINVQRVSGDENIGVSSGQEMIFSRRNYNQWQTVTVAGLGGRLTTPTARPRSGCPGEGVTAATIAATEVDNDTAVPTYSDCHRSQHDECQWKEGGPPSFESSSAPIPANPSP